VSRRAVVTMTSARRISIGQARCTSGASTTESSTHRSRLASKRISSLLTSTKLTALAFEIFHGDGWKLAGSVVLGFILMNLMNRDGGVDNGVLKGLLLDDGLDVLVDVVVDMLACDSVTSNGAVLGLTDFTLVLELSLLGCKFGRGVVV